MSNTLLIDRKATHKYIIATYTHHRQITCKLAGQLVCHSGSSHVGDVMLSYTSVNCKLRVDVDWHAKDGLVKASLAYECCNFADTTTNKSTLDRTFLNKPL